MESPTRPRHAPPGFLRETLEVYPGVLEGTNQEASSQARIFVMNYTRGSSVAVQTVCDTLIVGHFLASSLAAVPTRSLFPSPDRRSDRIDP